MKKTFCIDLGLKQFYKFSSQSKMYSNKLENSGASVEILIENSGLWFGPQRNAPAAPKWLNRISLEIVKQT